VSQLRSPWSPRSQEDKLLHEYWKVRGGLMIVEVPIGGAGGPGRWLGGTERRRIDAVRVHGSAGEAGIFRGRLGERFGGSTGAIELIEVKRKLNRTAIGQALAAQDMFERQYGRRPSRLTIVCEATDPGLEWVCRQRGIRVWCQGR